MYIYMSEYLGFSLFSLLLKCHPLYHTTLSCAVFLGLTVEFSCFFIPSPSPLILSYWSY